MGEGGGVSLRPLRVDDAHVMALVLADPALYAFTGGEPPTEEQLERRYGRQITRSSPDGTEGWLNWIVLVGNRREPAGYVQATIPADGGPAKVAWVIGKPWQGKGYGGRAAALLVDELSSRAIRRIEAHIHPGNESSQRVAKSVGMAPTTSVVDGEIRWEGSVAIS